MNRRRSAGYAARDGARGSEMSPHPFEALPRSITRKAASGNQPSSVAFPSQRVASLIADSQRHLASPLRSAAVSTHVSHGAAP